MDQNDTNNPNGGTQEHPASSESGKDRKKDEPHGGDPDSDSAYQKLRHYAKATYSWARIEFKRTHFHERINIFLTGIIALSTFVYVIATIVYVFVSAATLAQIWVAGRDSGRQMDQMIEATVVQAYASHETAIASSRNAAAAESFAKTSTQQLTAANKLANSAATANIQAEKAFDLQSRPWIGIDGTITPAASDESIVPINGAFNLKVKVTFNIENSGATPARRVIANLHSGHNPRPLFSDQDWRNSSDCNVSDGQSLDMHNLASTVFPKTSTKIQKDFLFDVRTYVHWIWIVGCISYQDQTGKLRHTKVFYKGNWGETELLKEAAPITMPYAKIVSFDLWDADAD